MQQWNPKAHWDSESNFQNQSVKKQEILLEAKTKCTELLRNIGPSVLQGMLDNLLQDQEETWSTKYIVLQE